MKVLSTWTKENAIIRKLGDEFIEADEDDCPIGDDEQYLIKLPKIDADIFFRLSGIYGHVIEFVSDEPLLNGFKLFYQLEQTSPEIDKDVPIDVYDDNKKIIRHITLKDLYEIHYTFSPEFIKAVDGNVVRMTRTYNGEHKSCIAFITEHKSKSLSVGSLISIAILCCENPLSNVPGYDTYDRYDGPGLFENNDMRFEVLDNTEFEELTNKMFE